MRKKLFSVISLVALVTVLSSLKMMSNPNCPAGYTTAPALNATTTRNCTSCHGGNTLNMAGGGITAIGLPTTYTAGQSYPFSVKITHSAANRLVWGVSIKAIDTLTHAVIGTWTTTNPNTSIKGTPTSSNGNYELSHANAAISTATSTYTYSNLTWVAPAVPTAVQARVKFYISAIAGNNSGDESGDYAYATSYTANQYVAPTPCTFTYGTWTTCSNGTQTRTYTTSPAGCTGTPPADSISRSCALVCIFTYGQWSTCSNGTQTRTYTTSSSSCTITPPTDSITRSCTMPTGLPIAVTIVSTITPGVCDTIRTLVASSNQTGVYYAWSLNGAGNRIESGQGTSTINIVLNTPTSVALTLSNAYGSIPSTTLALARAVPPTPSVMAGTLAPCVGNTITYTLTNPIPTATQVPAIKFRWTIPAFTNIVSANADSSSINLSFNTGFVGGSLSAKGQSACGAFGVAKAIAFSPSKAIDMISSTGFLNACIGNSVNYMVISPVASVTLPVNSYRWTKPANTTIISANADSSVITLQFNAGFTGGALKVQTATSCGALGTAVSKTLTHLNCAAGQRGSTIEILIADQVNVFPNPSNGNFTLNIQTEDKTHTNVKIELFDIYGRLVGTYTAINNNGIISKQISNYTLGNGMYIVGYTINGIRKTTKLIIKK